MIGTRFFPVRKIENIRIKNLEMDTDMKMHTSFGTVLIVFLIALICQPVNLFARPGGGRPGGGARPSGGSRPSAPSRPSPSARPAPSRPSPSARRLVGLHPLPNQQQDHGPLRAVTFAKICPQSRQEIYRARPARLQQVAFPGKRLGQ